MTDPYRVLLKNDGVAEGQMQNAFQSPLLFPPLSGLSRKPELGSHGPSEDSQTFQFQFLNIGGKSVVFTL